MNPMDGASLHAYGRMIAALNDDAIHAAQHADYRRTHAAREAEQWVALMNLAIADRDAMFLEAVAAADGDHERVRRAFRAADAELAATGRAIRADPDPSTGTRLMVGLSGRLTWRGPRDVVVTQLVLN